jgi:hypothetical protein
MALTYSGSEPAVSLFKNFNHHHQFITADLVDESTYTLIERFLS